MEKIEMPVFTEQKVLQYMYLCNVLHVFGVMNKSAISILTDSINIGLLV